MPTRTSSLASGICTIWLLAPQGRLTLAGATGAIAEHIGKVEYEVGEGITGAVASNRQPIAISGMEDLRQSTWRGKMDAVTWTRGPAQAFGALLAVPIQDDTELVGVLKVERTNDAPAYTDDDMRALEKHARRIAERLRKDDVLVGADQVYSARVARVELITSVNAKLVEYLRKHPEEVRSLTPWQFEQLIARLLEEDGWAVEMTLQTRDGGYDMLAVRQAGTIGVQLLVQAKKYRSDRPVGVSVIRELYAVKMRHDAAKALLATTSYVSAPAKAEFRDVIPWEMEVREYDDLIAWLGRTPDATPGS